MCCGVKECARQYAWLYLCSLHDHAKEYYECSSMNIVAVRYRCCRCSHYLFSIHSFNHSSLSNFVHLVPSLSISQVFLFLYQPAVWTTVSICRTFTHTVHVITLSVILRACLIFTTSIFVCCCLFVACFFSFCRFVPNFNRVQHI